MTRLVVFLLAVTLSLHSTEAKCSHSIIQAIQTLTAGQDISALMNTLGGEYSFAHVYMGPITSLIRNKCISATYSRTADGISVSYKGATRGQNKLQFKGGAIQILGSSGNVERTSYVIFHSDTVLAQYACTSSLIDVSFTSIAVLKSALGTPEAEADVAKAKDALNAVGIDGAIPLKPCDS